MSLSLREQLLQAGFGKKKPDRQSERQQRPKQHGQATRNEGVRQVSRSSEQQQRDARMQTARAAREQEQARRKEAAERKARWDQIKLLVEQHRLPKIESDEYFNFISRGKVRRLPVDDALRSRLISGELVIVRCEGRSEIVPCEVAENIRTLDERAVVTLSNSATTMAQDDPYKDYVVPDDLKW